MRLCNEELTHSLREQEEIVAAEQVEGGQKSASSDERVCKSDSGVDGGATRTRGSTGGYAYRG